MFKTFAFAATALTLAAGSVFAAPSDDARSPFDPMRFGLSADSTAKPSRSETKEHAHSH